MIVRCPSCTTRFELPALPFEGDGGMVRCPNCAHDWLEARPLDVVNALPALPLNLDPPADPDGEIQRIVSASRKAHEEFLSRRKKRRVAAAAWLGLALVAVSPAAFALAFPEKVVELAPATIRLYGWLGQDVNIYGLEIRSVEMQHLLIDGQRVIALKGALVNVSDDERKIPFLRFGLRSEDGTEVYQWQLDTESRPLRPGEAKSFVTRVASPPETGSRVEIRFARADEIGSNMAP